MLPFTHTFTDIYAYMNIHAVVMVW